MAGKPNSATTPIAYAHLPSRKDLLGNNEPSGPI
jgi:hypothetical protein